MLNQAQEWTDDGAWRPHAPQRRALPHDVNEIALVLVGEDRKVRAGDGKLEAIIPVRTLMRKLGATTYRLWAVLTTLRNDRAETHPSLPGLARAAGMSEAQTAKSLARLRDFKLVEDFGFVYRQVPCSCEGGCWGHKVYIRNVYGEVQQRGTGAFTALVPRDTVRLAMAAAGHGGVRKGAGRPRKVDTKTAEEASAKAGVEGDAKVAENKGKKSKVGAYKYLKDLSQKNLKVLLQRSPRGGELILNQAGEANEVQTTQESLAKFLSSPLSAFQAPPLQPKAQSAPAVPALATASAAPAAPVEAAEPVAAVVHENPPLLGKSETMNTPDATAAVEVTIDGVVHHDLGAIFACGDAREISLCGSAASPRQRYTPEDLRAASELSNQIKPLRVPAPFTVRDAPQGMSMDALLKTAFSAVHEKVMRTKYWRPRKAQTQKEIDAQMAALQALLDTDISPLSWARFSFHQWHRMGKKSAPTPAWVWSAKRILEHASWCRSATGTLITAQPIPVVATQTLMGRLAELRKRLGWGRPTEVVVSEVLPDQERQALLDQQAAQRVVAMRDIQQRIRNGEWVWG